MNNYRPEKLEQRKIGDLTPYPNNARTHSDAQIAQIARSIEEFGWTNPVLIDGDGGIIAGHGRVLAAKHLGMDTVPCIRLEHLTPEQRRAYVIADNQLALAAGWDDALLSLELKELDAGGFDLSLLGFGEDALAGLMADRTEGLTDPDEVPETPDNPVTMPGDVWVMGKHRLRCGDATNADDVAACLNGVEPHLMVTDPPYGVEYDAGWRIEAGKTHPSMRRPKIDKGATGKVRRDTNADWREAYALFPGDVAYVWHAGNMGHVVAEGLGACGFPIRAQIIWAKNQHVIGRGDYHPQHEPCWYAVRKNRKGHYCGGRKQTTIWSIDKPRKSETGHSTQKPVECMARPIRNNSNPGQVVYDPFLGSGTTIIAAEMEGRVCYGLEIHPPYCDVIVKRWQAFTGEQATLESTGETFDGTRETRARPS